MPVRLVQRRTVWLPTVTGWLLLAVTVAAPIVLWCWQGEAFLAKTMRQPADTLVVEGWIGAAGVSAARSEYLAGGYSLVVATGGLTGERWNVRRWNYAAETEEQLLRQGIPRDAVLAAPSREVEIQRTYEMAMSARRALQAAGRHPAAVNVFTRGSHARRSRLIFQKVLGADVKVGVVSWRPPLFDDEPWWHSSERAEDLLKETVGYFFELLFSSGRRGETAAPAGQS